MAEREICACLCSVTACSFVLKKSRKEEKKNWTIEEPRKYSLWNSDFSKKKREETANPGRLKRAVDLSVLFGPDCFSPRQERIISWQRKKIS